MDDNIAARSAADSAASAAESAESARQFCHDSGVNATSAETYKRLTKEYRDEVVEMVKDVEGVVREISEVVVDVERAEAAASNAEQAAADSKAYAYKAAKSAEAAADSETAAANSAAEAEETAQSFAAELEKVVTTDGGKTIGGVIRIKNLKIAVDDDPSHDIFLVPNAGGSGLQLQFPGGPTAFVRKKTGVLATTSEVATVKTAVRAGTDSGEQSDIEEPERVDGKIVGNGLSVSPAVPSGSACDTASVVFRFTFDQSFQAPNSDLILAKFGQWNRGFSQIIVRRSGDGCVLLVNTDGNKSTPVPLKTGLNVVIAVYEKVDQSTTSVRFIYDGNTLISRRFTGLNGLNLLVGGNATTYSGITFSQDIYRGHALSDSEVAQITDDGGEIPLSIATSATLSKTRGDIASLDRAVEDIKVALEGKAEQADLTKTDERVSTLEEQMGDLLYKAIAFTSGGATPGEAEIGASVASVVLKWSTNKTPTTLTLDGTALGTTETTRTMTGPFTSNKTWALKATDERGATATRNLALTFKNKVYWGVGTATGAGITDAFVLGLSGKQFATGRGRTFTANAGAGQYIYYVFPKAWGTPTFKVGGFEGGFALDREWEHTNASGGKVQYQAWRSTNASLGNTTVVVS